MKDNDIHNIKKETDVQYETEDFFYGSVMYWVILSLLVIIFLLLLLVFRQRAIDNSNSVKMRGKKANAIARNRLKKASRLMFTNDSDAFYDEVLRALWGYVSYKLNMPVEQLSRENISANLSGQGVDSETIGKFIAALDECEFERYAPGDPKGNKEKTFNYAMTAITQIENVMKRRKKR